MISGYGNLSKTSVPKLLHLIYSKGDEAAALEIVREPARKRFFFKKGLPVAATSNILNEVLGRLLVQKGVISQDDYQRSLEVVLRDKKRHGEVLISMGVITREKLDDFLSLQLKERILKVFGWTEGEYRYSVLPSLPAGSSEFPHHPAALIIEGIHLGFYPDSRAREELKGYLDKKLKLSNGPGRYDIQDFHLNLQEKRFLDLFDGTRTLNETLEATALLRHRAVSLALSFITTGLINAEDARESFEMLGSGKEALHSVEQAGGDSRLHAEFLFIKAKSALHNRDYGTAVAILREITDINPLEGEYWAYLGWAIYNENQDKIKEAQALIKDAIDLDNDIDIAWYFLGVLFLKENNLQWAERALKTAHAKNPWMSEAIVELKRLEIKKALTPPADADKRRLYADYFSFSKDPFSHYPDPDLVSLAKKQLRCVDGLVQGVEKNAKGMLLLGEEGTGKTTAALELIRRLSNSRVLCAMILSPDDKELKLMRSVNSELYASADSSAIRDLLISLGSRVSQNAILGGRTLIIIDRAERLTEGCLKLVQYLTRLKTLQTILIARPAFIERLKAPEFKELDQKLSTRLSLEPFTPEDTKAFILHRIKASSKGGTRSIIIKDGAIELLHMESRGLASAVNANAASMLALATELKTNTFDKELVELAFKKPVAHKPSPALPPPSASGAGEAEKESPQPPAAEDKVREVKTVRASIENHAEEVKTVRADIKNPAEEVKPYEEEAEGVTREEVRAVVEPLPEVEALGTPISEALAPIEQEPPEAKKEAEEQSPAPSAPFAEKIQPAPVTPAPPSAEAVSPAVVKRPEEGKGLKRLTVIILVIVLTGLAIGALTGYYYFTQTNGAPFVKKEAVPIATPLPPPPVDPAALPKQGETPPAADVPGQRPPEGAVKPPEGEAPANGPQTGAENRDAGARP